MYIHSMLCFCVSLQAMESGKQHEQLAPCAACYRIDRNIPLHAPPVHQRQHSRFYCFGTLATRYDMIPYAHDVCDVCVCVRPCMRAFVRLLSGATSLFLQRNKDRPTVEMGELDGEKVFLKYGKYGRCISCDGTVAYVR